MTDSFWKKLLADGSSELGTDSLIEDKVASWTLGRQDIVSTILTFNGMGISLSCPERSGELAVWKQKDGYSMSFSSGKATRLHREVECSTNGYKYVAMNYSNGLMDFTLNDREGVHLPPETVSVICAIRSDGKVGLRFRR
jgi:hypothetical protein